MDMIDGAFTQQDRKETTAPFGVNLMQSQVLCRAAQFMQHFGSTSLFDKPMNMMDGALVRAVLKSRT